MEITSLKASNGADFERGTNRVKQFEAKRAVASPDFLLGKHWPLPLPPDGELSVYSLERHNDSGLTPFTDPGRCISSMVGPMWPSSE